MFKKLYYPKRLRDRLNPQPEFKKRPAPVNALLWIDDTAYRLLEVSYGFTRHVDGAGRIIGDFCVTPIKAIVKPIKDHGSVALLAYASKRRFHGKIQHFHLDGINKIQKDTIIYNAYITGYRDTNSYYEPPFERVEVLTISPLYLKVNDTIYESSMNPSKPMEMNPPGLLSRADFEEEKEKPKESEYTLESTYIHERFKRIAEEITKEFEEDNENALYQVYRKVAIGEITAPPIVVSSIAQYLAKYDRGKQQITVREDDLSDIHTNTTKKQKLAQALAIAYGQYLNTHLEKKTKLSSSLLTFDAIDTQRIVLGTLSGPEYTGELTIEIPENEVWVTQFNHGSKGIEATSYMGISSRGDVLSSIAKDLGYFGYHPNTKKINKELTQNLDPIVAQWLEKKRSRELFKSVVEGTASINNLGSGIVYVTENLEYLLMMQLRTFILYAFGNKVIKNLIDDLKDSSHCVNILDAVGGHSGYARPLSLEIHQAKMFNLPKKPEQEDYNQPIEEFEKENKEAIEKADKAFKKWKENPPNFHKQNGIGDSCFIKLNGNEGVNVSEEEKTNISKYNIKRTELTVLLHEYYHAWKMEKGLVKTNEEEEIKAVQFVNEHLRSLNNRRPNYDTLEVPLEEKYKK